MDQNADRDQLDCDVLYWLRMKRIAEQLCKVDESDD